MKKFMSLLLAVVLLMPFCCLAEGEIKIVCTSFPCYDFARAIAGDFAEITLLIKPGTEVHSFEPAPSDIMSIASCDLFVCIGGESDAWVDDILSSLGSDAPACLRFFDGIELISEAEEENEFDEHIWTSPRNAAGMVNMLADEISLVSPYHAGKIKENAAAYTEEINSIDEDLKDITASPARKLLVFADRFPFIYLTEAYGLEAIAAFPGCSSETEPSASIMMQLIETVTTEHIPVVYTIELSNEKTAKAIAEETGAGIEMLYSVQTLTQEDFDNGETYVTLMRKNVEALAKGLN